ncbi:MAG TPA: helix-turn-helix domain-containing protein, partial [Acidimicrobiales bacterium]|nr:helix-turn-helix domain-containing protein [Acidimicrobiales bacterium]
MAAEDDSPQRTALIEAAARLVAEEGPSALSTRRLAAEVGTSTMAVYTWFGGMPQLLRALLREGFRRFGDRLRSVEPTDDPVADLGRLGIAYRDN